MKKIPAPLLIKLTEALFEKTGLSESTKDLKAIADKINDYNKKDGVTISETYLYFKILNPIKNKKETMLNLRDDQLNCVTKFLGYLNFKSFAESLERKSDPQLQSLIGNYYSYVRRVVDPPMLFRSPVKIWKEQDGKVWYSLKGPRHVFTGEVKCRLGCLFVLMESEEGKAFQHVYKIGAGRTPQVLQGTFSGISTASDPIGGRTVLIRMDQAYESLSGEGLLISDLKKSKQKDEKKLAIYFNEYYNNNVAPNRAATFGLDDLG